MTPKEKAEQLVFRFINRNINYIDLNDAKKCALISVEEIIRALIGAEDGDECYNFYCLVRKEIKNL